MGDMKRGMQLELPFRRATPGDAHTLAELIDFAVTRPDLTEPAETPPPTVTFIWIDLAVPGAMLDRT